jgi:hypothetical protein
MTAPPRVRLPNRRRAETRELTIGNLTLTAEVFLDGPKTGSTMSAILGDAAVTISIALQFGIPARALAKSISRAPDGMGRITAASVIGAALDLLVDFEASQDG